jgi:hypothetical protein
MSNRTKTRHRFAAIVSLSDTKKNADIHYPEPSSDIKCPANETCTVVPDYLSKCLYSMHESHSAIQKKRKFNLVCNNDTYLETMFKSFSFELVLLRPPLWSSG